MTIRRQYSLPNCTLVLEGLSNSSVTDPAQMGRPSLDIVMRFECHLANQPQALVGGRDLLESLLAATNQATQEWLSGVRHSAGFNAHRVQVQPKAIAGFEIQVPDELLVSPVAVTEATEPEAPAKSSPAPMTTLHLSTVQMFDLVEALDQLLTDSQTLPDLPLVVKPLSRREAVAAQPIAERAAPLALGTTALVAAAAVCFFLPIPEVRRPEEPTPEETPAPTEAAPSPTLPTPNPTVTPEPQSSNFLQRLTVAAMITDPQQLRALGQQLEEHLQRSWRSRPLRQPLVYHVGVNPDGQVVGYRGVNLAAIDWAQLVPLPQLLAAGCSGVESDLAQFCVVFYPQGNLQVTVWAGAAASLG